MHVCSIQFGKLGYMCTPVDSPLIYWVALSPSFLPIFLNVPLLPSGPPEVLAFLIIVDQSYFVELHIIMIAYALFCSDVCVNVCVCVCVCMNVHEHASLHLLEQVYVQTCARVYVYTCRMALGIFSNCFLLYWQSVSCWILNSDWAEMGRSCLHT